MINLKAILKVIGFLMILDGIGMMVGIPFSLYHGDDDIFTLVVVGSVIALLGGIIMISLRNEETDIRKKESYLIVGLGWLVMSLFGAIPFVVHGAIPSYTDAFFETISGFTTTGASILNDIESLPHGLLFWRSLTQWLGGMGIIVLSLAILPILGIGGMQLFVAEVPGPTKDKIHPRIRETAKRLWGIYILLTVAETVLLMLGGMNLFDAINHSFTTMATGGFSTKQASVGYWNSPFIHYVIIFFMFAAGMNFTLHYFILHKNFKVLTKNEEFRAYFFFTIIISVFIAISLFMHNYGSVEKSFRDSLFQVVSMITTTGYATVDYESWGSGFIFVFFLLLFVGGSAGSTGGGIKVIRHLIFIKNSLNELKKLLHPQAILPIRFNSKSVPRDIVTNIVSFGFWYLTIFLFGSLILAMFGLDFLTAISATATALGNVGPGISTVGPSKNFSHLPDIVKWVLSILMLIGRLELFTILVIFSKEFWKK